MPKEEIPVTETLETPTEELTRGTTFAGRYEIIEELGKGGMGKVYRVEDKKIKEEVALKLIKPEIASDKMTIERFSNELKMARKIAHRNVGRMYHLSEHKSTHYITMEYVSGEDLKSFIRRSKQLAIGTAISITKQVCEGMAEAHRLGVIHRDLKPSNIMIDREGNARIMDFGIARSLKSKGLTGAGVMVGTPEYMSPEQTEAKEVDCQSDIYSLGVILYEMMTGQLPFEGDTPLSIAMKHKSETPKDPREINPQIPEDLSLLILKCLEKRKEDRYPSSEYVFSELSKIEQRIPTTERIKLKRKPITSKEITVTFGVKKLLIPAIIVFAVVIATLIILKFLSKREAALAPKIENSIAVISFENQTGDEAYDYLRKAIPNLLISNLENTGLLYVVTWERMRDILEQIGKKDVETIDRDLGFEVCRLEGVEAIVLGSFIKAGDVFHTDVKVLDAETKKIMKSHISRGEGVDSILKTQIDELSKEISQGLGIARQKIEAAQSRIADATTNSLEAYNYYLRGREEAQKYYEESARRFHEKAVELDPTFASAYLSLAESYGRLGNKKASLAALEEAKTFSEKATEKERLYIELAYARAIEKNPEKRIRILKQMAKKYPKEKHVHFYLGNWYSGDDNDKAIEEYNKALELDPNDRRVLDEFAMTLLDLKEYEKAFELLKKYVSVYPGEADPLDCMGFAYFRIGRLDEAIAKYKEALAVKPDFHYSALSIQYVYALKQEYSEAMKWLDHYIQVVKSPGIKLEGYWCKGFYYFWLGSLNKSLRELQEADKLVQEIENESLKAFTAYIRGWIYYDRGKLELSRKYFKDWFNYKENNSEYPLIFKAWYSINLGFLDLKERQIDSARSRLNEAKSLLPKIENDYIANFADFLSAEILLQDANPDKAIAILEKISFTPSLDIWDGTETIDGNVAPLFRDVVARAYQQTGEIDKAIEEYERLITFNPESEERYLIHPKYHYRLAKLYEQKGWKGKAIEHYEKFLSLWKDADPGIVEVEDAKDRLAKLKIE
jgi:serine/threonine protein kinase/Tfp pilus assembly protein PilF